MSTATRTENEYLEGIRKGDRVALERLYKDCFPRIASFIRTNGGHHDDAQDIFQDAVMVLHAKARQPDFALTASLFTFLYAVARNLWLKRLKKHQHETVTTSPAEVLRDDTAEVEEAELMRQARYQLYRRKFRELGEGCQKLLELGLSGKSIPEIMSELGMSSEVYTRKRKFQCKEQLAQLVRQDPAYRTLTEAV